MHIDDKEFFDRIAGQLDKLSEEVSEIKQILTKQQGELNMHIYRTELAEEGIELLSKRVSPLETKNNYLDGSLKFIGVVSSVSGLLWVLVEIVKSLNV